MKRREFLRWLGAVPVAIVAGVAGWRSQEPSTRVRHPVWADEWPWPFKKPEHLKEPLEMPYLRDGDDWNPWPSPNSEHQQYTLGFKVSSEMLEDSPMEDWDQHTSYSRINRAAIKAALDRAG